MDKLSKKSKKKKFQRRGAVCIDSNQNSTARDVGKDTEYCSHLYERFQAFSVVQSFKKIRTIFMGMYGRHSPIIYKKNYGFK